MKIADQSKYQEWIAREIKPVVASGEGREELRHVARDEIAVDGRLDEPCWAMPSRRFYIIPGTETTDAPESAATSPRELLPATTPLCQQGGRPVRGRIQALHRDRVTGLDCGGFTSWPPEGLLWAPPRAPQRHAVSHMRPSRPMERLPRLPNSSSNWPCSRDSRPSIGM